MVAFVTPSIMAIVASTDCTNCKYRLGTKKNIEPIMLAKNKTSTELITKNKTEINKQALIFATLWVRLQSSTKTHKSQPIF